MKKLLTIVSLNLCFVFLGFSVSAQTFQTIADGVEHARDARQMKSADGKPESVVFNLLRLDLSKVRLDVVHAMDAAIGLEKTSSIADRYGAIAAVNAGFFRIDKSIFEGDDVGVLMIDGKLLSESYANRTALFIENKPQKSEVNFVRFNVSQSIRLKKHNFPIDGINRQRKANELILFTPEFHGTTLTDSNGLEIVVQNGRISQIVDGKGSARIPPDGFVLSASGTTREIFLKTVKKAEKVKLETNGIDEKSNVFPAAVDSLYYSAEDVVSGVPQLIKNNKIDITWQQEKSSKSFVETHHPRTAVAKLKDGKFLMVAVDGRSEESGGISLPDLAAYLLELGATEAMNLDGGGSTTMFLNGKIVNRPSDKEGERAVGDAILVFPRAKK